MKYESVSEIANFGEDDSDSIPIQESIDLLDQIAPATKLMHFSNTAVKSIFANDDSFIIKNIDKTKPSIYELE